MVTISEPKLWTPGVPEPRNLRLDPGWQLLYYYIFLKSKASLVSPLSLTHTLTNSYTHIHTLTHKENNKLCKVQTFPLLPKVRLRMKLETPNLSSCHSPLSPRLSQCCECPVSSILNIPTNTSTWKILAHKFREV